MANVLVKLLQRERTLFLMTALWAVDHLVGWYVYGKYSIGITVVADLVFVVSFLGFFIPDLSRILQNGLAIAFFVGLLGPAQSTMTFAFLLATLLARISYRAPIPWAGAYIASGVYLFAGLNELFSKDWTEGRIIEHYFLDWVISLDFNVPIAYLTVLFELALALALLLRLRVAIAGILALHIGIVTLVSTDLHHVFSLVLYGAIMLQLAFASSTLKSKKIRSFLQGKR